MYYKEIQWFSAVCNSGKRMIEEKYPQAKITVIDSTINTVLQGLFVLEACRLRDMGMDYEEIIEKILPIRETGRILLQLEVLTICSMAEESESLQELQQVHLESNR